jgi:hypothetical protein
MSKLQNKNIWAPVGITFENSSDHRLCLEKKRFLEDFESSKWRTTSKGIKKFVQ